MQSASVSAAVKLWQKHKSKHSAHFSLFPALERQFRDYFRCALPLSFPSPFVVVFFFFLFFSFFFFFFLSFLHVSLRYYSSFRCIRGSVEVNRSNLFSRSVTRLFITGPTHEHITQRARDIETRCPRSAFKIGSSNLRFFSAFCAAFARFRPSRILPVASLARCEHTTVTALRDGCEQVIGQHGPNAGQRSLDVVV